GGRDGDRTHAGRGRRLLHRRVRPGDEIGARYPGGGGVGEERRSLPPTPSEAGVLTDSGLAGKAVIVTGGSRGIGRAIVEMLSAEGADVTFLFRENTAAAAEVIATGRAAGRPITAEHVDVRD